MSVPPLSQPTYSTVQYSTGPQPPYALPVNDTELGDSSTRFTAFVNKYQISSYYQKLLQELCKYHIVLLIDDSGSMQNRENVFQPSRWEEAHATAKFVIEAATIFEFAGIDVHFLEGQSICKVTKESQIEPYFNRVPEGRTPLIGKLKELFDNYQGNDKPVLLIVNTDGVPNDYGNDLEENERELARLMGNREANASLREKIKISFALCIDDENVADFYRKLKKHEHGVDVTEYYPIERAEMERKYGSTVEFTAKDCLIKTLLGAVIPQIGKIDDGVDSESIAEQRAALQAQASQAAAARVRQVESEDLDRQREVPKKQSNCCSIM